MKKLLLTITLLITFFTLVSAQNSGSDSLGKMTDTGEVFMPTPREQTVSEEDSANKEIHIVEDLPEFPGGDAAMQKFIADNLKYPRQAKKKKVQGRVTVQFTIDEEGNVIDVSVLKGIGWGCDEEAVRLVKSMPRWKPGTQRKKPVKVRFVLPIRFRLG